MVAILLDEEANVRHWLEFHRHAGIRQFFLYDNGCTDRTIDMARAVDGVEIKVIPWKLRPNARAGDCLLHPQVLAYAHAIANFGAVFRWMTFLDLDEYIFPTEAEDLPQALERLTPWTNVSLPWTMFGPSGQVSAGDQSPAMVFMERARRRSGALLNFKCIVDPCDVTMVSVHKFWTRSMGKDSVNSNGQRAHYKKRAAESFVAADAIRLNHYCTLSEEQFAKKLNRAAISGAHEDKRKKLLRSWYAALTENTEFDDSARRFLERSFMRQSFRRAVGAGE